MPSAIRAPCAYEEFDSGDSPSVDALELWQETGRLPMAPEPAGGESACRFRIRVGKLSGPSGRFADLTATPVKFTRLRRHCGADGLDMIALTLVLGVEVQHALGTGQRSTVVKPGQILVKDFSRPATSWWQHSCRSLNLHVPRIAVEAAVGDRIDALHGLVLSAGGLAQMLQAQFRALANIAPGLTSAERATALDTTVELAASVLRCELGARIEDESNNAGLFAAAQVFIRRHFASARLRPDLIAQQLRCSRAHLYRVFAEQGDTVANCVREHRLRRAYDLLSADAKSDERIGDVAYRCGFEDPVHFTRVFRQRFGVTPSALRDGNASPIPEERALSPMAPGDQPRIT